MDQDIRINQNIQDEVSVVISTPNYVQLSENVQNTIITTLHEAKQNEGGLMGKLFGTNKDNASIHIVFVICAILLILCIIDIICAIYQGKSSYTELTKNIIPLISLAIGYLLGKGKE